MDIGNTRTKWVYWDSHQPIGKLAAQGFVATRSMPLATLFQGPRPEQFYVANVAGESVGRRLTSHAPSGWPPLQFIRVDPHFGDIRLAYQHVESFGVDRWLAMHAAWELEHSSAVIADCGSAVTLDLLDAEGKHHGGMIFPGLSLMRSALAMKNHAVKVDDKRVEHSLGDNTLDGVNIGCETAIAGAIEYGMRYIAGLDMNVRCLLTGGDADRIQTRLRLHGSVCDDLVLQGMAIIARTRQ